MSVIRWGIIGCGKVTEVKSGPAFQQATQSSLVAVMRRNGELARDYAQRHGVPKWYDDAEALINDREVDAVYVATPPSTHKHYALLAARAGKPVYVEKPMALDFAECEEMIEACASANVPLFVAYYRRALPRFLQIKALLDSGAIGEVRFAALTLYQPLGTEDLERSALPWRVLPQVAGGGRFVDLASHMLDFLDFALGPVTAVGGFASNQAGRYPAEDIVTGTLLFESGVHAVGSWCFTSFDRLDRTEVVGSEGRIVYSTFDDSAVQLINKDGVTHFPIENPRHIQLPLIQTVVDALNGIDECPSTGESAARTSWVMEQMLLPPGERSSGA